MFSNSIIAATATLLAVVAAVPMADLHRHHHHPAHKRDYVWFTRTEVAIETVAVTKTVWIEPGATAPSYKSLVPPGRSGAPRSSSSNSSSSAPASAPPAHTPSAKPTTTSSSSAPPPPAYTPPAEPTTTSSSSAPPPPAYTPPAEPTAPTSTYVAPPAPTTPSTTAAPATYTAPSSSSSAAPATYGSTGDSSSSSESGLSSGIAASGSSFSGDLTWYDVGLGACGWTNVASDHIVAISEAIFDSYGTGNPNNNPICGKSLTITGVDGQPYRAKIVDRCGGCKQSDLDLSQDFFNTVTNYGDGRVSGIKWTMD